MDDLINRLDKIFKLVSSTNDRLKYDVHDARQLEKELYAWLRLYNEERFHQGLAYKTPDEVYRFSQAA